jgi:ribonuclease-3
MICKAYALIYSQKCDIICLTDKEKRKGETVMDWARIEKEMHELEAKLGYTFKDISLLAEAMKSQKLEKILGDGANHHEYSNESMAFLGDTIIKFLLAKYLYGDGKNKRKGAMTDEKSKLENNKTMHNIMMYEQLILFSYHDKHFYKDNPPQNEKVVANKHDPYIEAITAAIYNDGGWEAVTIWFENWLLPRLERYSVSN